MACGGAPGALARGGPLGILQPTATHVLVWKALQQLPPVGPLSCLLARVGTNDIASIQYGRFNIAVG
jgi:hypothetical protein